jgi:ribonucleoside-diphosphate reductase alpha chain
MGVQTWERHGFMNTVVKIEPKDIDAISFQEASLDIWDKKYRLTAKDGSPIDKTMDDTYKRVARALADVEMPDVREHWYEHFLWALRRGAIPAGRVTSNAGALEHKPATSTINCTVSGTIRDSMDDILGKVHEAGLTLKSGCGIGYEFSTLRPRGAYVSGAGAYTSGPLSFMDIYDKMCFTVSSAGGRRGAQMGTFDVGHPDAMEFIRAKRENGRLRQFNLSLLITDDFMQAVREDRDWKLAFPLSLKEYDTDQPDLTDTTKFLWREWPVHDNYVVNEEGLVACKIYKTLKARRMWDVIMSSTYDFAEPGFILIDRVNEMNNNWWCENVRATNPCVTADTRLATQYGMVRIGDLYDARVDIQATVDWRALGESEKGVTVREAVPAFMTSPSADIYRVVTEDGYEIKATEWHDFYTARGKIKLKELKPGDELLIQSGKGQFGGCGSAELGVLLGLLAGDGHFTNRGKGEQAAVVNLWGLDRAYADSVVACINTMIAGFSTNRRDYRVTPVAVPERNLVMIRSVILARVLLEQYGFTAQTKLQVPEIVWRGNEDCVKGYLRGLFQADGTVQRDDANAYCTIRLASSHQPLLKDVQLLLANFGIFCRILRRRPAGQRLMPDGKGGQRLYDCRADYELIIGSGSRDRFMDEIGFLTDEKNQKYALWRAQRSTSNAESFRSSVATIEYVGREAVFDTTQPDKNNLIFNGLVTGNCGEQPLPPYGSCLLGSVNLTRFVKHPFSEFAEFDWVEYREVVKAFTRMLDNVVEVNGLPLEKQREEILRKRRHGMGFLGLGSTMTLLGMKYGSPESVKFTEDVSREMAVAGWEAALDLAREKGPAPIMNEEFTVTKEMLRKRPEMARDGWKPGAKIPGRLLHAKYSRYMQRVAEVAPQLVHELAEVGARFTHHTSIAPTGTISLSLANNASNGIEPSFAHYYFRNVIRQGRKTKEKVDVFSFELLAYRQIVNAKAIPGSSNPAEKLPDYFTSADDVTPTQHVDIQAAAQRWVDSSISKTANVPTDYKYDNFKDIYLYAHEKGLKGCTTFRFNPEAFQGVLVKEEDLKNTTYVFTLEDGTEVEVKGDEEIEYDGEKHTAANLFDAIKEGYYGKL